jgi:hypothetical protein
MGRIRPETDLVFSGDWCGRFHRLLSTVIENHPVEIKLTHYHRVLSLDISSRDNSHIIVRMAKRSSKLLAMFLLLGMAAISLPRQETTLMHAQTGPAAGCHQHGAKVPARVPSSYLCCQLGHNSAILPSSLTSQPSLVVVSGGPSSSATVISVQYDSGSAAVLSPDPPHTIPLRV